MPLPIERTITGRYVNPVTGKPYDGTNGRNQYVVLTPYPSRWLDRNGDQVLTGGGKVYLDTDGRFTKNVVCTDADDVMPETRLWQIDQHIGGSVVTEYLAVPEGPGPLDITDLLSVVIDDIPYVPVPGPPGPQGPQGPAGTPGAPGTPGTQPPLGAAGEGDDIALRSTDPSTSNARTPTPHASSHSALGSDPLTPGSIGAFPAGDGESLDAAVTGLQEQVNGASGLENRMTEAEGAISDKLTKTSNLADLPSPSSARSSLGLGGAAVLNVGSAAGTVAAGDDARIAGAFQSSGGTVNGNLAVTGYALGQDFPSAHGVAAWCYDPALAVNSTQVSSGLLYLVRVNIASAINATKVYWWIGNQGLGPVSGQNEVGLYNSAGNRLAATNVDANISSAGLKTTTIPSTPLAAGSFYWVALLFNASGTPTLTRASGWTGVEAAANLGLPAAALRFATNGSGRTALPPSIIPASNLGTDFAGPWAAVGA